MPETKKSAPTQTTNQGNATQTPDSSVTALGNDAEADAQYSTIKHLHMYLQAGFSNQHMARAILLKMLLRLDLLSTKVEEAFAGKPFHPNFAPDSPINKNRAGAYLHYQSRIANLLLQLVQVSAAEGICPSTMKKDTSQKKGDKQETKS